MNEHVIQPRVAQVENMVKRAVATGKRPLSQNACAKCNGELWISFFFDGTGNDKDVDIGARRMSNVAGLFEAHINDPEHGILPVYLDGAGTGFDFADRYTEELIPTNVGLIKKETEGYHEDYGNLLGRGIGTGIDKRIEKAIFEFLHFLESASRQKKINKVYLSAFGFSRGAATARAFLHWFEKIAGMSVAGKKLKYQDKENEIDCEVEVLFLGLFDTVESIGRAGRSTKRDEYPQTIPDYVKKCVHLISGHELRPAFPITVLGKTNVDFYRQIVYPGVHSDVGGGYSPTDQTGKTTDLSRMINKEMLQYAWGANIKIASVDELKKDTKKWGSTFSQNFTFEVGASNLLNSYQAKIPKTGTVSGDIAAHLKMYWAYMDGGYKQAYIDRHYGGIKKSLTSMRSLGRLQENDAVEAVRAPAISSAKVGALSPTDVEFFDTMVHDSFEGFAAVGVMQSDVSLHPNYYAMRGINQPI